MHLMIKCVVELQVQWPLNVEPRRTFGSGFTYSICVGCTYIILFFVNVNTLPQNKSPDFVSYAFPNEVYKSKLVLFLVMWKHSVEDWIKLYIRSLLEKNLCCSKVNCNLVLDHFNFLVSWFFLFFSPFFSRRKNFAFVAISTDSYNWWRAVREWVFSYICLS